MVFTDMGFLFRIVVVVLAASVVDVGVGADTRLAVFSKTVDNKRASDSGPEVKDSEMTPALQKGVMDIVTRAFQTYRSDQDELVLFIKKELDDKYGGGWQVFLGTGSSLLVSFRAHHYIHLAKDDVEMVLWKCP